MNLMQRRSVHCRQQRQHAPRAPRARGAGRSCRTASLHCVSSTHRGIKRQLKRAASARSVARSRDPIGYKGSPWSLYEYVLGRPLMMQDPSGLRGDCHRNYKVCTEAAHEGNQACLRAGGSEFDCGIEWGMNVARCTRVRAWCILRKIKPRFRLPCLPVIIRPIDEVLGGDPTIA